MAAARFGFKILASPEAKKKSSKKKSKDGVKQKRAPAIEETLIPRKRRPFPDDKKRAQVDLRMDESENSESSEDDSATSEDSERWTPPKKRKSRKKAVKRKKIKSFVPSKDKIRFAFGARDVLRRLQLQNGSTGMRRDLMYGLASYFPHDWDQVSSEMADKETRRRVKYEVFEQFGSPIEQGIDFSEDAYEENEVNGVVVPSSMTQKGPNGAVAPDYMITRSLVEEYKKHFPDIDQELCGRNLMNSNPDWLGTLFTKFVNYACHSLIYSENNFEFDPSTLFELTTGYSLTYFRKFRNITFFGCLTYTACKAIIESQKNPRGFAEDRKLKKEITKRIQSVLQEPDREPTLTEELFHEVFPSFKKKSDLFIAVEGEEGEKPKPKPKLKPKPKVKSQQKTEPKSKQGKKKKTRTKSTSSKMVTRSRRNKA